jgi:hypothetical protein
MAEPGDFFDVPSRLDAILRDRGYDFDEAESDAECAGYSLFFDPLERPADAEREVVYSFALFDQTGMRAYAIASRRPRVAEGTMSVDGIAVVADSEGYLVVGLRGDPATLDPIVAGVHLDALRRATRLVWEGTPPAVRPAASPESALVTLFTSTQAGASAETRAAYSVQVLRVLRTTFHIDVIGSRHDEPLVRLNLFPHYYTTWYLCDNGGELNVGPVNLDERMRSIPYTGHGGLVDAGTVAYRIAAVLGGEEIDYVTRRPELVSNPRTSHITVRAMRSTPCGGLPTPSGNPSGRMPRAGNPI